MMEEEAKGISLSTLLREIIEKHYGFVEAKEEPFILKLEKAITVLGKAKAENCSYKEECPLKSLGIDPSTITCSLCQIHTHNCGFL